MVPPSTVYGIVLGEYLKPGFFETGKKERKLVVLLVEQQNNGVYTRKDLLHLRRANWDVLEIVEQVVFLGQGQSIPPRSHSWFVQRVQPSLPQLVPRIRKWDVHVHHLAKKPIFSL